LQVPESRARPDGRQITLAYVRLRGPAALSGPPIVYLAGGPGSSGLAGVEAERFAPYYRWLALGDIIAIDQRGTGQSIPSLTCPQGYQAPTSAPADASHVLAAYRAAARTCADHWRGQGVDLGAYTTEANADDVADLARHLGLGQIRLFGASYGSHLGLSILRRHPGLVERAVLGAIEGPDDTIKLPADAERQLDQIGQAMAADQALASALPNFRRQIGALVARADAAPIPVARPGGPPLRITGFDIRLVLGGMIGRRADIERLPAVFAPALAGDFQPLADAVEQNVRTSELSAMGAVMDCASFVSVERLKRVRDQEPHTLLGMTLDFPLPDWCDAWGVGPLPDAFRSPVKSDAPVLFIAGDLDGQTPPANAEAARSGFRNGRLFVVHDAGHDSSLFLSSPELFDAITSFMAGGVTTDRRFIAPPLRFKSGPEATR
jgi:pimeloyl-ACP methyl ester carboxylesterase